MKFDAIVIGAGLGGLTAGAKLAKEGKKVLLVEQHVVPGGCATTFKRRDFNVEVGLHEMDGLDKNDSKIKIFEDLGVFNNVEFVRVPEFYRYINPRVDIVVPDDYLKAIDVLVKRFPNEERGIRRFFKVIMGIHKEVDRLPREKWKFIALLPVFPIFYRNIMLRENATLGQFLDSVIQDEDLKLVLLANLGYYHDNPYTMSLLFYAVAQGSYFSGGGHFIKGGSQKLSNYLVSVIERNGGEVLLRHLVTSIITKDNKAIGVRYRKTSGSDTETQEAFGDFVVANAAIPNVVNELLPPSEARDKLASVVAKQEISCSLISVYLCFKRPPKEMGNKHYSIFVAGENVSSQSDLVEGCRADWSKRGFVFVDYSQIDSQLAPENKGLGVICTFDYLSDWESLSKEEYRAKKEEVAQVFVERLDKLIPGIKEEIELYEVGTSKTIKRYTINPEGTVYGFAQIPKQAGRKRIQQKSPIENLYFASAWTMPGHGFSGAIIGGYLCAEEILRK
jgi:phytoene dehydrogenase-like protein